MIELEDIVNWMRSNKLSLNFTKAEFLLITKAKRQKSFEIKINGHAIQPSSYAKYLGVYIDDKLTWKKHVNTVCSKIGKRLLGLGKVKKLCESKNTAEGISCNDTKPYPILHINLGCCFPKHTISSNKTTKSCLANNH